ncbi:MAG: hypothetical protein L6Q66_00270 [Bacteroidia bacterium]|nr:hypothetical protein [Bacteroidia bacterium]
MKRILIFSSVAFLALLSSCKKEYTCVCTVISTGERSEGDKIKTGKLEKEGYEEACKSNESVFNDLKDCHLEE